MARYEVVVELNPPRNAIVNAESYSITDGSNNLHFYKGVETVASFNYWISVEKLIG